ncbi:cupin domain-containing protein [Pseudarthrobacter sp. J75]|uniref:cupin domain-containing protein n=1 Tax=unclassified Pseudarthrobacter TaxID=2647000 RepID=UPI002E822586|nr:MULTISPECIES: cupin domain-containing protein [unclassified Pseudarthrobacter]MEE2524107.1 cupin domain-containing protein [Pseudarthrobacter sp. J47]MEE2530386.1 cupin domain-containing protein [Pseudarthrobacter sp. J75]MEE2568842.1 cupin domain-containing protein [Pseudarthrobacter sp. J64]
MSITTDSTAFAVQGAQDPQKLEPFELGQVQWLRQFGDGDRPGLASGFWHVTTAEAPEPFDLLIEADETIHIIEGHLRIEVPGGAEFDLKAGSAASFNKGTQTRWTVLEDTIEFFVYS